MNLDKLLSSQDFKAVFLPIKPRFIALILSGKKKVEYRRRLPKQPISLIVLYSSSPVKKIVGFVHVMGVSCASRAEIWRSTSSVGGISRAEFLEYFKGADRCCCAHLGNLWPITSTPPSRISSGFKIPQSYRYVTARFVEKAYALSK